MAEYLLVVTPMGELLHLLPQVEQLLVVTPMVEELQINDPHNPHVLREHNKDALQISPSLVNKEFKPVNKIRGESVDQLDKLKSVLTLLTMIAID